MKTFRLLGWTLATILLCLSACSGGGEEEILPLQEEVVDKITTSTSSLTFSNDAGEQTLTITASNNWTISIPSNISWCTISQIAGTSGTFNLSVKVQENLEYDQRNVSLNIKCGNSNHSVTVTQKQKDALLVTTNKYEVDRDGGNINVEVKANIDYQIEIAENAKAWINEATTRALTAKTHAFTIAPSEEYNKRVGEIYVKSGKKLETVKVYQSGSAILMLSQNEQVVNSKGDTVIVEIKSNFEYDVQMPQVDWIKELTDTRAVSSHTLKYLVTLNKEYDNRSAQIIYYDKKSDLADTLKITQLQKDAIFVSKSEVIITPEGGDIEVLVNTNIDFETEILNPEWISEVTPTRGLVECKRYFTIAKSDSDEKRTGQIVFKDKEGNISDTLTIFQFKIPYVTFTAEAPQSLRMSHAVETFEYSVNGANWATLGTTEVFFGGENGDLRLRGKNSNGTANSEYPYSQIIFGNMTPVACTGDIRTLIDFEHYDIIDTGFAVFSYLFFGCKNLTSVPDLPATILSSSCYSYMFTDCSSLTSAPDLPATILANDCYASMFSGCTGLTSVPELPATTLASSCYDSMFSGCTGLTSAPALPATTLARSCYSSMFRGCTGLTSAPELPATTLAGGCYSSMFYGCTSLTSTPELHATTLTYRCYDSMFYGCTGLTSAPELTATALAGSCYFQMFSGCTGLTSAPELPATTLASYCYARMFSGCTGLTSAPDLSATTLADLCYERMFSGCTGLTSAPKLPATTLASSCYSYMFYGCTGLTSAPDLPATTLAQSCYQQMFYGCTGLTSAPKLPATTLASSCYSYMFYDCTKLNNITMLATDISATECLLGWLLNVSSTGTFTKAAFMTSLPTGVSGIPKGWTVVDYSE